MLETIKHHRPKTNGNSVCDHELSPILCDTFVHCTNVDDCQLFDMINLDV